MPSVRERERNNTRLRGLFKYCPKPVAPSSALYNPHVYKYIYHGKEVRSGRCGDLFTRGTKEKKRKKLHCYTYFFFGGYMCIQADHSWGSMKYLFLTGPAVCLFVFWAMRISKDCFHLKEKSSFVLLRVYRLLSDKETFLCQSDDVCYYRQYTLLMRYRVGMKEGKDRPRFLASLSVDPFS